MFSKQLEFFLMHGFNSLAPVLPLDTTKNKPVLLPHDGLSDISKMCKHSPALSHQPLQSQPPYLVPI